MSQPNRTFQRQTTQNKPSHRADGTDQSSSRYLLTKRISGALIVLTSSPVSKPLDLKKSSCDLLSQMIQNKDFVNHPHGTHLLTSFWSTLSLKSAPSLHRHPVNKTTCAHNSDNQSNIRNTWALSEPWFLKGVWTHPQAPNSWLHYREAFIIKKVVRRQELKINQFVWIKPNFCCNRFAIY